MSVKFAMLGFSLFYRIFCGEPVFPSPENAMLADP
jgi:hypothetical protein